MAVGLAIKPAKNTKITALNSSKQLTVTVHGLILIREGLLSEGYLRLRFGGLIFGRAYYFFGGGGWGRLIIGILRNIFSLFVSELTWEDICESFFFYAHTE